VILPMPLWKRTIDIVGAAVLIAVLSPVLLLVGIAVAIESPGGPIFRQVRVGKGGRTFVCWKFRSMRRDAEQLKASLVDANEANGHLFKMKNDPRRTRVGVVIRKTSLDELPQLWNVLRGEMSLVGPRPPVPEEVERYEPHDLHRLVVEPGITGLWQVTARQRHHFPEMVALDIEYAERRSLGLDLRIALKTIGTVVKGSGSY
jgi:lipopolysaccharide/colanic/teichoic acid biosynthesis glycosyltransferase